MTITIVVPPVCYLFALVQVVVLCSVYPIAAATPEEYLQSHGVAMAKKESMQLKCTCFIIVPYLLLNESSHSCRHLCWLSQTDPSIHVFLYVCRNLCIPVQLALTTCSRFSLFFLHIHAKWECVVSYTYLLYISCCLWLTSNKLWNIKSDYSAS